MKKINESIKGVIQLKHPEQVKSFIIILLITMDVFFVITIFMYGYNAILTMVMLPIVGIINIWGIIIRVNIYDRQMHYTPFIGTFFLLWGAIILIFNLKLVYFMFDQKSLGLIYGQILSTVLIWVGASIVNMKRLEHNVYYKNKKHRKKHYTIAYIFSGIMVMVYIMARYVDERYSIIVTVTLACALGVIGLNRLYWAYLMKRHSEYVFVVKKPVE